MPRKKEDPLVKDCSRAAGTICTLGALRALNQIVDPVCDGNHFKARECDSTPSTLVLAPMDCSVYKLDSLPEYSQA